MADYLILQQLTDGDLRVVGIQSGLKADEAEKAIKQGYAGDGDYIAVRWDNREEFSSVAGPPTVNVKPRVKG